jgi:riboflavin synthase
MFTGLVEAVGELAATQAMQGGVRFRIATPLAAELAPGDSIAVNGVCLTVVSRLPTEFQADLGPETLRVTTLGGLTPGTLLNLERPLRADSRLGGHFVQGHVDAVGRVEAWRHDSDFSWLSVSFPPALAPSFVLKGSVAVDGISLTVAGLGADHFDVQVIPYTMEHTNLKRVEVHTPVNLECDIFGKYVARAVELAGLSLGPASPSDVRH